MFDLRLRHQMIDCPRVNSLYWMGISLKEQKHSFQSKL